MTQVVCAGKSSRSAPCGASTTAGRPVHLPRTTGQGARSSGSTADGWEGARYGRRPRPTIADELAQRAVDTVRRDSTRSRGSTCSTSSWAKMRRPASPVRHSHGDCSTHHGAGRCGRNADESHAWRTDRRDRLRDGGNPKRLESVCTLIPCRSRGLASHRKQVHSHAAGCSRQIRWHFAWEAADGSERRSAHSHR